MRVDVCGYNKHVIMKDCTKNKYSAEGRSAYEKKYTRQEGGICYL